MPFLRWQGIYICDVETKKPVRMFKVACEVCKAQMGLFMDSDKGEKECLEMWNQRTSDLPTIDYGVSNFYWQILHDINPKLADDASIMAKKQVEDGKGIADIRNRPVITDYELPVSTTSAYEKMLTERDMRISDLKSSVTRFKHLYEKEKNCIGKKKVGITSTDFTKIRNIKQYADALYEIFDERFKDEYGDDYAEKASRRDNF